MDNVTHTLAGLLLGEAAVQLRSRPALAPHGARIAFRRTALWAAAIAGNLPDADLLYSRGKLGYLLHHRGHTHTLLVASLLGVATWAAALALWRLARRWRAAPPTGADSWWLLGLCVVAALSHVVLDYGNSYGVHPFWPASGRWYYGDTLFILEPWLWAVAVPALLFAMRRPSVRIVLVLVLGAGLAAEWTVSYVPWGVALSVTLTGALFVGLALRLRPRARIGVALAGWAAIALVFAAGSRAAREQVERTTRLAPGARMLDLALTPAVSNPLCYGALAVEVDGPLYRASSATIAAIPSILPASDCARAMRRGSIAAGTRSSRPDTPGVRWESEWSAPLAELRALARENCLVGAALRFVRVPIWLAVHGDSVYFGDLRYGRGGGAGFAEMVVPARPTSCPANVPPWRPPRADLLGPERTGG